MVSFEVVLAPQMNCENGVELWRFAMRSEKLRVVTHGHRQIKNGCRG